MADFDLMTKIETALLKRVLEEFDRAGLAIPEMHSVRTLIDDGVTNVDASMIPFIALAQHHGAPTRLLDWSTLANVAAYFAAADIARPGAVPELKKKLEIIAMHRDAVTLANDACANAFCDIVRAPRASNANLHAQSGVFTICHGGDPALEPLDSLFLTCYQTSGEPVTRTLFRRFRLPQAKAGDLLHHLMHAGVSGATMFPGYDGAVQALKERKFYIT